ncbi:MAG: HAD-IIIA family hydrolase [Verrucomicrobiota bacterium]
MTLRPAVFLDRDGTLMEEVHYCADPALVHLFPGTAAALRQLTERGYLCVIITNQSGIGRGLLTEAQYHAVQTELFRQLETQEEEENLELRNSGEEKSGPPYRDSGFVRAERSEAHLRSPELCEGISQEARKGNEMEFQRQVRSQMEFGNEENEEKFRHRETQEPEGFQENSRGLSEATPPEPSPQATHPEGVAAAAAALIAASYFCPDAPPTPSPRRKPEPGMVLEAARDLGIDLARSWFVGDKAADIACGARSGTRTILVQTGYGAQTAAAPCEPAPDFLVKDVVAAAALILQKNDAL